MTIAVLLSALCLLSIGGAVLLLLLWQQSRASGVLTTQLERTWDLIVHQHCESVQGKEGTPASSDSTRTENPDRTGHHLLCHGYSCSIRYCLRSTRRMTLLDAVRGSASTVTMPGS